MRYTAIVTLETELQPQKIIQEIVSNLEFDPATQTTVDSVVVLIDDGVEVGIYNRNEKDNN